MKPQLPSRLPVVITELLALLRNGAGPLAGVQVIDGPVLDKSAIDDDAIAVAPGTDDQPGAVSSMRREETPGLGGVVYVERIEVAMVLASYSGEIDMGLRRERAAELLAGVKAIVDANQVRASVWDEAGMGPEILWFPKQNRDGAAMEVGFSLMFRAII